MSKKTKIELLKEKAKYFSILYVEDEETLRNKTAIFLSKIFKNVEVAFDGKDGLDKYFQNKYDIVITDILMPNMNGLELISNIRKKNKKQEFIITSAYTDQSYLTESIQLGVTGYLIKPLDFNNIIDVIEQSLDKLLLMRENEMYKRKLEDTLKITENKANQFFDLSINLLLIADFKGNIIQINSACKNILGYENKELIATSFIDLIHPDDVQSTVLEMKKLEKGEVVYYFENRYRHKNNTYITLAWSANSNTSTDLIYASAQNISKIKAIELEKKKQEEVLRQQSKMATMGEMIENIAHQWRQPLSIISAAATGMIFKNKMNVLQEDDIDKSMHSINNSVQHLSQTIDDFRDFFKTNKNKKEFALNNTFEKTFKLITSQFKNMNILIIKNIENVTLLGYERELMQVLINILNNARDELIKKEQDLKLIIIDSQINNTTLEIYIKDNAGGIPFDIIDEVFNSHFTTKQDSNGTGIGLYMSKMIIEEHMNGIIEVINTDFEYEKNTYTGAQFKICLPMLPAE